MPHEASSGTGVRGSLGRVDTAVFVISGVGLAYEIALVRVMSIAQWHHCAYMVISMAMLGFGVAGVVLALTRRWVHGREPSLFRAGGWLLAVTVSGSYALSQRIPFEAFELATQPRQLLYLTALYLALSLPFFVVSAVIALAFMLRPQHVGRVYFASMSGSAMGAGVVVALMYVAPPGRIPWLLTWPSLAAWLIVSSGVSRSKPGKVAALLLALALCAFLGRVPIRMSSYKGMSYVLQYPDARVLASAHSPLSEITAVASERIRETPGQLSNYPMQRLGALPRQIGLFFDGAGPSVVTRFNGDLAPLAFLDYVTAALPYQLVDSPRTLVVGGGGGSDVLMALSHGAEHVTVVEVDPRVFSIINEHARAFSGGLFDRPDVTPHVDDGRQFVASSGETYDLIQIALLDSFNASAAGVYALSESYLYTVEAMQEYMDHLSEKGVLAITRWLKTPPRDAVKMFASMALACERSGAQPAEHMVFIRSWNTGTLLLSRSPLTKADLDAVRGFCERRQFDVCYMPGLDPDLVNRFTVLEEATYFEAAKRILGPERERFFREYLFHVRPSTDDKPHFFRFFKWASLPRLVKGMGFAWMPFVEWGYLAALLTLVQAVALGFVLVLLPLFVRRRMETRQADHPWVLAYFGLLGLAYMFLEIAFIQKFMLLLAYPVFAVGVVLAAFLLFSGCGSLLFDRWQAGRPVLVALAVPLVAALSVVYLLSFPWLFSACAGWPTGAQVLLSIVLMAPLAFFMGIPFPMGLQWVSDHAERYVPWAWGLNGFASVVGSILATIGAVHTGFSGVVLMALVLYGIAHLLFRRRAAPVSPRDTGKM